MKKILLTILVLLGLMVVFFIKYPSNEETPTRSKTLPAITIPTNPDVILATTTSVQDTGLLDILVALFKKETGYKVKAIAVGSGEAMAMGKRGDADIMLVHSPKDEEVFMKEGFGKNRRLVMTNYFILVGPPDDPAGCRLSNSTAEKFKEIAATKSIFISRGDNSGTHKRELSLWQSSGITPAGAWYLESKSGMGIVLQIANEKNGYTLTDKGTYLAFKQKLSLVEMYGKDDVLINRYSIIVPNQEKLPKINLAGAEAFADFLTTPRTQKIIGEFGLDQYAEPLFYPINP